MLASFHVQLELAVHGDTGFAATWSSGENLEGACRLNAQERIKASTTLSCCAIALSTNSAQGCCMKLPRRKAMVAATSVELTHATAI